MENTYMITTFYIYWQKNFSCMDVKKHRKLVEFMYMPYSSTYKSLSHIGGNWYFQCMT